jgi:hypothetical protein
MSMYDIERICESDMTTGEPFYPILSPIKERLYFISDKDGEFVKIGVARNPQARLSALQIGNPRKLILLAVFQIPDRNVEKKLHGMLYDSRSMGEWFLLSGRASGIIKELFWTYYCGMNNETFEYLFNQKN